MAVNKKQTGAHCAKRRHTHRTQAAKHNRLALRRVCRQHAIAAWTGLARSSRHQNRLDPVSAVFLGRIELLVHCLDEAGGLHVVAWRDGASANADGDALIQR
jgi:hypothetical protein